MEEKSLEEGGVRIKFACTQSAGPHDVDALRGAHCEPLMRLAAVMARLERAGAAPVLPDGLVGGNAALRIGATLLFVSRSGKPAGHRMTLDDFVLVTSFDESTWACTYQCGGGDARPSSDTPLLWGATLARYDARRCSVVAVVHGHAIAESADALALQCPISDKASDNRARILGNSFRTRLFVVRRRSSRHAKTGWHCADC